MANLMVFTQTRGVAPPPAGGLETLVGNTPLLPLERIAGNLLPNQRGQAHVRIFGKAEWFNPAGSVKDRPALNIIRAALAEGKLRSDSQSPRDERVRLLDSTSGNMGIAYATFGAAMGIPVTLAVPANASPERLAILRALGAELVLTDPTEGSDGALRVARQMAAERPERYYYANQYDNPANWQAHYATTGPEIFQQTEGQITHFVAGLGTTGTLTGAGRYLREVIPGIQVIAVQPDGPFHGLEGLKHIPTAIQPGIYDPGLPDRTVEISTEDAHEMTRRLAREEGIFAGISAGAAALAALRVAEELKEGVIVAVFPDAGYKYLSDKALWRAAK